jgi:hypothetical protein
MMGMIGWGLDGGSELWCKSVLQLRDGRVEELHGEALGFE